LGARSPTSRTCPGMPMLHIASSLGYPARVRAACETEATLMRPPPSLRVAGWSAPRAAPVGGQR
jgi:hypothetical protein